MHVCIPLQVAARETIAKMLAELNLGRTEKCVRVNSVSSGLAEADLEVILQAEVLPPALMLPKVEDIEEVQWVSADNRSKQHPRLPLLKTQHFCKIIDPGNKKETWCRHKGRCPLEDYKTKTQSKKISASLKILAKKIWGGGAGRHLYIMPKLIV